MKTTIYSLLAVAVVVAMFFIARPAALFQEDTRRLTFEHSRSHRKGVNDGINSYCLEMRRAKDPAQAQALAQFIVGEADNFEGQLTPAAQACVRDANAAL